MVDHCFAVVKNIVSLPADSRKQAKSGVTNPVYLTIDCIEERMYKAFDEIMDYNGDDSGFIKLLKDRMATLFVTIIQ